jgi:AcrR family transcriptional regulator
MTTEIISRDPSWPYSKAKTAVLAAAAFVIREEGPRAATLKNIAGRAGITEPAIFRHFEGVDGLFGGLFHAYERIYRRFGEAYEGREKGLAKLRSAMLAMVDYLAASGDFAYVLVHATQVFRGYPDLRKKVAEYLEKDQKNAIAAVAEGVRLGEVRDDVDPESLAMAAFGTIFLTTIVWIESAFAFDLREVAERRWEDIEALIARPGVRKPASRPARKAADRAPKAQRAAKPERGKAKAEPLPSAARKEPRRKAAAAKKK